MFMIVYITYIHTTHALTPKGHQGHLEYFFPDIHVFQNYSAMRNTADVTGKLIAVWSQYTSGVNAVIPLVAFYDIHGRKREVLFFYSVTDTTRDLCKYINHSINQCMITKIVEIAMQLSFIKIYCTFLNPLLKFLQKWDTMFFYASCKCRYTIYYCSTFLLKL
jgi:hypothetical protein